MWLPIETAPKDDTPVDIWTKTDGRLTDMYLLLNDEWGPRYMPLYNGPAFVDDATHWMPIPGDPEDGMTMG